MPKKASSNKTRAAGKKKTARKPASKTASSRKKATKAPARKPKAKTARKPAAKKAAAKPSKKAAKKPGGKPAPRKPSAKPAPAKATKPAEKPAPPAKAAADASKPARKPRPSRKSAGATGDKPARASKARTPEPLPIVSLTDARAAASRLAAAAGLPTLRARSTHADDLAPENDKLDRTPLTKKELEYFREILKEKRNQVAGDVTDMEKEALGRGAELSSLPQHMADQGSDEYDQSLSLGLAASQRGLLREIDAALERIANNTFGVCEALGKPISKERLEATPWARHSLEGARMLDRGRHRS